MADIIKRLEKWLEKDSIVARNWGEDGFSIDGDIELAIEEIKRLRQLQAALINAVQLAIKCLKTNISNKSSGRVISIGTCHRCHRNKDQCTCEFPLREE